MSNARLLVTTALLAAGVAPAATPPEPVPVWSLQARVVAVGLHRAHGIRQVGRFHSGGPFTSNPEFLLQTQAGHVLDPERVLIAVDRNLGAALGNGGHAAGAVVSVDPRSATPERALVVPADLALRPAAAGAAVMLYSVQSAPRLNRQRNGNARTADFAGVSGPRYLSINNAFGRPWVANAPFGLRGEGSESVLDPDGAPLANAPSDDAGGVFVGARTGRTHIAKAVRAGGFASLFNRQPSGQLTPGAIEGGAFGTALLGASPDGSGFAVFAAVTGTGAVVQIHVQDGVDGLAAAGTIDVGGTDPGVIGIAFKWARDRALYIADARRDRIAVLHLTDDARQFKVDRTSYIESPLLRHPVDLAACVPEIANPRFASHTTLAGDADLYVVNAGDGSLLRLRQDGTVVARAVVAWPGGQAIGAGRLRSIAVSADAQRVWLIAEAAEGDDDVLIETTGFDARGAFVSAATAASANGAAPISPVAPHARPEPRDSATAGARLFATAFTPRTGLGPRFNADSCIACHPGPGGASASEAHFARRVAHMDASSGRILPVDGQPSAFAPRRTIAQSVERNAPAADLPRWANVISLRMPLPLFAASRLDEISDTVIEAQAVSKGDGIKGRVHRVTAADGTQRVGRYGWKADTATLDEMVAAALVHEMGMANALAVHAGADAGAGGSASASASASASDDGSAVRSLASFVKTLVVAPLDAPPASRSPTGRVEARQ
jgi:Di-haem oxidoreductase, putative peroxidase